MLADIDMIIEARVPESEAPSAEPAEDTVLVALFVNLEIPPPPPREHAKRHRGQEEDEARARKKECRGWKLREEPRLLIRWPVIQGCRVSCCDI